MELEIDVQQRKGDFELDLQCRLTGPSWAVFGPSGAGKSTLLNIVAGLERPDSGTIVNNGHVLVDTEERRWIPPEKRRMGYVFQDHRLFPHMTVQKNLEFAWDLAKDKQFRPLDVAKMLDIDQLLKRGIADLSGGEKQRIAIARAVVTSPGILLLDEPCKGLDEKRQNNLLRLLRRVNDEFGIDLILVSHDLDAIFTITDQIMMIDNGRTVACASYLDLLKNPDAVRLMNGHACNCGGRP